MLSNTLHIEMSKGTIPSSALALLSYMKRKDEEPSGSNTSAAVVDNLLISSTGYSSSPFIPAPITGVFWTLPVQAPVPPIQPAPPVVPPTLYELIQSCVFRLMKKQRSVHTFVDGLTNLGVPDFVIQILLTKLGLVCEKNGKPMVVRDNMDEFVKRLVLVKNKVYLMDALVKQLREASITWASFLNPIHKSFFKSDLSKGQKTDVLNLLMTIGFVNPSTSIISLPSGWASLSIDDCRNMIWNVVCQSEITTSPPPPPPKGKKRCRDEPRPNKDKERMFSVKDLMKTFFNRMIECLLQMRGCEVSLNGFIENAFLDLSPNHLHQLMDFLSSQNTIWILQRILMEVPHLNVAFGDGDVFLSRKEQFSALSFNMNDIIRRYHLFSMEAIVHHQDASQRLHEEKVLQHYEREHFKCLNEEFILLLKTLWKTKKMETFFIQLRKLCPEFDSKDTCWILLKQRVVNEFIFHIYNATTRTYHNGEPCETPLQDFLEYTIKRGVFRTRAVRQRIE